MSPADARPVEDAPDMTAVSDKEFSAIYDDYYLRIRGFIRASVRDEWYADDLTQETFLRARRHIDSLRDLGKIKSWLFRIAHHKCLDHYRSGKNRPADFIPLDGATGIADSAAPEKKLEQKQMNTCVNRHLMLLPASYRTVLWLFDVQGFTQKEIAEVMDVDVGNIKVRLHRARKKMKAILESNCRFERDDRNIFVCVPKAS
jgi:RNA polymerase sigma-70 factor (ECF subfamily)